MEIFAACVIVAVGVWWIVRNHYESKLSNANDAISYWVNKTNIQEIVIRNLKEEISKLTPVDKDLSDD